MESSDFLSNIHTSVISLSFFHVPGTDGNGRYHLSDIRHHLVGAVLGNSGCPQGSINCYLIGDSST